MLSKTYNSNWLIGFNVVEVYVFVTTSTQSRVVKVTGINLKKYIINFFC